jgi:hypothetical protein
MLLSERWPVEYSFANVPPGHPHRRAIDRAAEIKRVAVARDASVELHS